MKLLIGIGVTALMIWVILWAMGHFNLIPTNKG